MTPNTFHHKPAIAYCGLTIILSNPSRFDSRQLLSANSGTWLCDEILKPARISRFACDIRTSSVKSQLQAGTKVVLCLGEVAQHEWMTSNTTLSQQRGSPVCKDGVVFISSFFPQDAFDFINFEGRLNPHHRGPKGEDDGGEDEAKSHKGATKRTNYKFWLACDVTKACRILKSGLNTRNNPEPKFNPGPTELIQKLERVKGSTIYLDIETLLNKTLTCIGVMVEGDDEPCYVIPVKTYKNELFYDTMTMARIFRALSIAMRDNLCVTHNGHAFDWLVLAHHYRLPFGRSLYDTMIAQNRIYPEAEKSLGHCLSLWTDEAYHKDDGVFDPQSFEQERQLWAYNAKDVYAMRWLKKAFDNECSTDQGLKNSIEQGQSMIYPYMVATMKGMKMNEARLQEIVGENDRYMEQLKRMVRILVGPDNFTALQGNSDSSLLSSNLQAGKYFYGAMSYKCPYKTDSGANACDAGAMLKLKIGLANRNSMNPVIDLRLTYAGVKKETSMLAGINSWPEKAYL